jgi:hypothetical protein
VQQDQLQQRKADQIKLAFSYLIIESVLNVDESKNVSR